MNFIEDIEIDLRGPDDKFDTVKYSETLSEIIQSAPKSSFCIGVFGEWGSGKSSIINTAISILNESTPGKYGSYLYDAWKYSEDSFRRTFLLGLANKFKLERSELFNSFYKITSEQKPIRQTVNWYFLVSFIIITFLLIVISIDNYTTNGDWKFGLSNLLVIVALGINFSSKVFKEYIGVDQQQKIFAAEQFEECFDEILSNILRNKTLSNFKWLLSTIFSNKTDKLVVVIDNIDRCDADHAYQLLSTIKNFLGRDNIIFIIPVDDSALRSHVINSKGLSIRESDEFLRKLFNNTLKIKPYRASDLFEYTKAITEQYDLEFQANTIDVIAKEYASNPRRIMQFINSLISELKYLTKRKGSEFSNENETMIAIAQILREEWPDLYKILSNAPFKIRNIDLVISDEHYSSDKKLEIFLRKISPYVSGSKDAVLRIIFSNRDEHPLITEGIVNIILSGNKEDLSNLVESDVVEYDDIVQYWITELSHAEQRGVLGALAESFNSILFLNSFKSLRQSQNKRIAGIIHSKDVFMKCLENANPITLAEYLNILQEQNIQYLSNPLSDYLNILCSNEKESEPRSTPLYTTHWMEVIKNIVVYVHNSNVIKKLQTPFLAVYRDSNFSLLEIGISEENIRYLMTNELMTEIINRYELNNDSKHSELIYVLSSYTASHNIIELWISKYLSSVGVFDTYPGEIALNILELFRDVLKTFNKKVSNKSDILKISDLIFQNRTLQVDGKTPENVNIYDEVKESDANLARLLDILYWSYIATEGDNQICVKIIHIANQNDTNKEMVLALMQKLHEDRGKNLNNFHDYLSDINVNSQSMQIFVWLLLVEKNQKYIFSDENAKKVLSKYLEIVSNNSELLEYWKALKEDDRTKNIVEELVSEYSKEQIIGLPKILQQMVYNKICKEDNIFDYSENIEFLSAMSEIGNRKYNEHIDRIIFEKINKIETLESGINLIKNISNFNGIDIEAIKNKLIKQDKLVDDEELKDNIKEIIELLNKRKE